MVAEHQNPESDIRPSTSLTWMERMGRPLFVLLAGLLIVAAGWSWWNQATQWSRPVELVFGVPGELQAIQQDGRTHYRLLFTEQDSGAPYEFWVINNGVVLEHLQENVTGETVALRYWTDNLTVAAIFPLTIDTPPIQEQVPPALVLLGTSILGMGVALFLLLAGRLSRGGRREPRERDR